MDEKCRVAAFKIASEMRAEHMSAEVDHMNRSVKAQLKYADKIGAEYVVVIGENELASGEITVKRMSNGSQRIVKLEDLKTYLWLN